MSQLILTDGRTFSIADINSLYDKVVIKENLLSITKLTKLDNKDEVYNTVSKNIENELDKRKQDIKLLEKSYEDLSNNIKENFDLTQEQDLSRELYTLLGQINKHKQR